MLDYPQTLEKILKPVIAIDFDETLVEFDQAWRKYYLEVHGKTNQVNWSTPEAIKLTHAFINSYHHDHIETTEGAVEAMRKIVRVRTPVVVTFRDEMLRNPTVRLMERHYPNTFKGVHFIHNQSRNILGTKADVCVKIGAREVLDDVPFVVTQTHAAGIRSFLLHRNTNKDVEVPGVTRIMSWRDFPAHIM